MNPVLIRVAVADDHSAILFGVKHEFAASMAISVDGLARDSTGLIDLLDRTPIDVLVCDYAMPGGRYGDGMALLTLIRQRYPHVRIVVLTMLENPAILQSLMAEVRCIVSKSDLMSHLSLAVHAAFVNGRYASPAIEKLLRTIKPPRRGTCDAATLSGRELEVVRLFVSGLTVTEIAAQLHRSKKTVSTQKNTAMRKLNIARDVDLVRYGMETGIIPAVSRGSVDGPLGDS
ncbi:response regulator transcription factor [Ralstonia flaminis]|jgi:two-component system capsular synthesis response regulator RcsB|uniref:Transcriptional regulatory protein RcsB n=1 Tax=Ralstonia flaminis TaxID=3058597 RepID=A0ABM9KCC4_9RALS|nr:response regulator transcription factor [Ralstonia sp. LMG 18101]CAJ0821232.1 Transcriptional regulatory protein RcsB [Ralstonia sp. LMG 18101]